MYEQVRQRDVPFLFILEPTVVCIAVYSAIHRVLRMAVLIIIFEEVKVFFSRSLVGAVLVVFAQHFFEAAGSCRKLSAVFEGVVHSHQVVYKDSDAVCVRYQMAYLEQNHFCAGGIRSVDGLKHLSFESVSRFLTEAFDKGFHGTYCIKLYYGNVSCLPFGVDSLQSLFPFLDKADAEAVVALDHFIDGACHKKFVETAIDSKRENYI